MDTIQKIFELLFDEAAWRQPSLIVLDDLDHIAAAPAGPEFEMSGEALYAARIAEGMVAQIGLRIQSSLTHCLPMFSADNLCKQFGYRLGSMRHGAAGFAQTWKSP